MKRSTAEALCWLAVYLMALGWAFAFMWADSQRRAAEMALAVLKGACR